jgi:6,7-dimethyl-8-ribityllumazine synthase
MSTILIVWSNYYPNLSQKQLECCLNKLRNYHYSYELETVQAGSYEIPAVIQHYHQVRPFDGYLPLGLLLKGKTDHYTFIWEHIKECFIRFSLGGLSLGNGIISAPNRAILEERVENGERIQEAINALDYLIRLKNNDHKNNHV